MSTISDQKAQAGRLLENNSAYSLATRLLAVEKEKAMLEREIEELRRDVKKGKGSSFESIISEARPNCGACPGEGSICPKSCRLADENPGMAETANVPLEPTADMFQAAQIADMDHGDFEEWLEMEGDNLSRMYRAMIAAAPAPAEPEPVPDMKWLKEVCTSFFYWWHNQPGANTQQGFDGWLETENAAILLARVSAPSDPDTEA